MFTEMSFFIIYSKKDRVIIHDNNKDFAFSPDLLSWILRGDNTGRGWRESLTGRVRIKDFTLKEKTNI